MHQDATFRANLIRHGSTPKLDSSADGEVNSITLRPPKALRFSDFCGRTRESSRTHAPSTKMSLYLLANRISQGRRGYCSTSCPENLPLSVSYNAGFRLSCESHSTTTCPLTPVPPPLTRPKRISVPQVAVGDESQTGS